MIEYLVNSKTIKIKSHKFEGKQSIEFYENQIYSALSKIGISKNFVDISYNKDEQDSQAQVFWTINKKNFEFRCFSQETLVLNLGALAQAIQEDVRQITRGIKDLFQIMTQYETKSIKNKKTNLLAFNSNNKNDKNENFKVEDLSIDKPVNESLHKDYYFLQTYDDAKLDSIYFKLKEQCIKQNKPNHKMLKALKIVREKRGLRL